MTGGFIGLISGIAGIGGGIFLAPAPAHAVLNSPNAQIARSTDVALRRSTPAFNPDVKAIQVHTEQFLKKVDLHCISECDRNIPKNMEVCSDS